MCSTVLGEVLINTEAQPQKRLKYFAVFKTIVRYLFGQALYYM